LKAFLAVVDTSYKGELSSALKSLRESNYEVTIGILNDIININHQVDLRREKPNLGDYDAVMVIGGYGLYYGITGKKSPGRMVVPSKEELDILGQVLSHAVENNAMIIAPLVVPAYMAKLGLLRGKKATVYPLTDLLEMLINGGAEFINATTVIDGRIITMKRLITSDLVKVLRS